MGGGPPPGRHRQRPWWEIFGDPVLNEPQGRARAANQDLRAALARLEQARAAAREAADLSGKRYRAGLVSYRYLEVVDSERTALATERAATQILGQRLQASVSLVKALGGGWEGR